MLDINYIRNNPDALDANLARRGLQPHAHDLLELDATVRELTTKINELQNRRNEASKDFHRLPPEQAEILRKNIEAIKGEIIKLETELKDRQKKLDDFLITLPNFLMAEVPDGKDDEDNKEIRKWGNPRKFNFQPKEHWQLGEDLKLMDFELGAKLAGSRFVVMRQGIARLHRALGQFMIDMHVHEHGFEEIDVPLMVRPESMEATTHLPKYDNGFHTTEGNWLIPSAEVALINLYRDTILTPDNLPIRMTALTPCFRSEAGAAGKDTKGMLRQHQFYKVELVTLTHPDRWKEDFDYTVACAETVLQRLELPYRLMQLCAGDCATKEAYAIDPEVWLPGQNRYREICTWACTTDYQSRRAKIRFKDGKSKVHPYIIYGSGTAVGRALIAVMENYQQEDGSIIIPEALKPYMKGLDKISAG